jgi:pyruvate kinase
MVAQLHQTKMVCTLGPASDTPEMIGKLIDAGMDVARMNFSHGSHEDHARRIETVRTLSAEKGKVVAILQDLQGPKIRTGKMKHDGMTVTTGQQLTLRLGTVQEGNEIPIDYAHLANDVEIGARILLDDGLIAMKVIEKDGADIKVEVTFGGLLKSRKGVNFPDSKLSIPATTEKDIRDLFFGVSQHVDFVALSFVQSADDIIHLKKRMKSFGGEIPVVAKIEMKRAIENLDAICDVSDAIMVARGDLGVECGFANVASYQKIIIATAKRHGIPVIVATQMLDSMQENCTPTKAEVMDVANAVLDGADATMLSGESASGKHPVLAVETMRDLTLRADAHLSNSHASAFRGDGKAIQEVAAHATVELAVRSRASAIVCLSMSGATARLIASYRPSTPIIALSPRPEIARRLALVRGVHPVINSNLYSTDKAILTIVPELKSKGLLHEGDLIVLTAGTPLSEMKPTNLVKLFHVTEDAPNR